MKLKILVGTMTSTADYVAQAIQMDCADLVEDIEVQLMDALDSSVFNADHAKDAVYLICSSTYGSGDVPDNARALYESLSSNPQFLGHVRYGVIALGDRTYLQTFCFGGKKFDERLQDLGAQRIGEVWCHDASSGTMPESEGTEWCRQWLTLALQSETAGSAAG
ncbi:MAG: nitric oxide synthase [Polaromonas sp. 39-63-203]|jgi:MioC protein|uniref:flavodoxin domain-containing protein n=1 Tax=Polaromonas sp. TaxID=1869339 RepID=UPI000BD6D86F|nr:flavodoxin domain-containing protein [Polaromonas sp.]OYZ77297.1 MAG: nitric oxide synthase [Polaromonas sp. 24-62-144]OZA93888.1 MAG: nitric oxide synthase [Polaromonas sp. 39-63-203]HQS31333.1 flavodoxin domain-containing protein [Polaromonas sp.]HQS90249.1 flavodoxin domain-containing protein [Polaromonas sp.]